MDINRNNYEAYLLDLLEGRLNSAEQKAVRDFLSMNPDCAPELNEQEYWTLETGKTLYPRREQLKKEFPDPSFKLNEKNFDLFSIARLEGDLSTVQEEEHRSMVSGNNKWKREWELWEKTRLTKENIAFAGKDQLRKHKSLSRRVIWISVISSAAVIALIVSLLRMDPGIPVEEIVQEESPIQNLRDETNNLSPALAAEQPSAPKAEEKARPKIGQPAILSNKKHQDPPELTGIRKNSNESAERKDTISPQPAQQVLSRPIKISGLDNYQMDLLKTGTYDKILPLMIPPTSIHIASLSISQLADIELQELFYAYTQDNNISLWSIANAGLQGINRITGTDMSLMSARDEEGDVTGFRFRSRRFSFATPIDRSE